MQKLMQLTQKVEQQVRWKTSRRILDVELVRHTNAKGLTSIEYFAQRALVRETVFLTQTLQNTNGCMALFDMYLLISS